MLTLMMPTSMKLFLVLILLLSGCTVEKYLPDGTYSQPMLDTSELQPCDWQALTKTETSILEGLHEINIQVQTPIKEVKDEILLQLDWNDGVAKGTHSKKAIQDVLLKTGEDGAQYEIVYEPISGFHETLGAWLNWNTSHQIPFDALHPNDIGNINLNPDGATLYRIHQDISVSTKGLAFVICGIGGMEYASQQLGNALLKDGWIVTYIFSVITTPDTGQDIPIDGTVESLIELFDHRYCQLISTAKTIQADAGIIDSSNFVLIGISAGALNTPAIYEALPVKPKCVALVAGGANLPEIVQKSTLTNWDFVVDGKFLTIEQRQTLSARYLDTFSRDPYHLSGLLPREKTLLLHAKWDKIVPAENGDLLWDRSGRPERWVYPSGHLGLFAISHDYARELVDWIQEKLQ